MADISIIADYSSVKAANKELLKVGSTAQKSAAVYTQAFKAVDAENKRQLKSVRDQISFSQKMERQKAREAKVSAAAAQLVAKEEERLKNKFVQGYTAMDIYTKELNDLAMARKKDIISSQQQSLAVEALNKDLAAGTGIFATYGNGLTQSSQHMSRSGVAMQQVGYQVGDFIVQVQSGQNPMVAFGQQATQMVGALYMLPPATLAGSVGIMGLRVSVGLLIASLGIIIPLATAIGAAFMRMKKDSDGAGKSASSLDEKLKSLKTTLQDYADTLTAMRAGVSLDELFATRGIDAAEKSLADAKAVLGALETSFNLATSAGDGYLNMADDIAKLWGGDAASKYAAALQVVTDAEKLLADLHTKEADTRAKNFADSLRSITQETTLLQIQAKFGEDSAEAINEALAQETLNRKAAIDQRVIAGDLDATAAATLKQQIDLQADLGAQINADAAAKVDAEARSADLQEKINIFLSAQQRIRNENGARMQEQLDLERDIHQFAMSQTFEKRQQRSAAMELLKNAIEVHNKEKAIREEIGDAAAEALKLAGIDITSGVDAAAKAAAVLAANLGVSLLAAQNMVNLQGTKTYGGRGSGTEWRGTGDYQNELGYKDVDTLIEELNPETKTKKTGGGKSPQEELAEFLTKKKEEADLQSQLVGLFGEERDLQSELIKFKQDYGKVASQTQVAEFEATVQQISADKERQKVLEEAKQQQEQLADYIANSMGDALMSVVDGTMSVKDAFKSMATDIIKELYRVLVVQQLVNSAKGFLGFADGGAWQGGSQIQAYANGGVVGGPTFFPMAGGKTGLMGEAGPEAIMPLKRGANGKLGVQMEGGGGDTIVVNQSFNFQANGDDTVKRLIAQAAPKIAQMTKSSLLDDRRRGGSTKAAFG